ncbi:hypothetical protein ACOMHN_012195 [Nucella lapillus]
MTQPGTRLHIRPVFRLNSINAARLWSIGSGTSWGTGQKQDRVRLAKTSHRNRRLREPGPCQCPAPLPDLSVPWLDNFRQDGQSPSIFIAACRLERFIVPAHVCRIRR